MVSPSLHGFYDWYLTCSKIIPAIVPRQYYGNSSYYGRNRLYGGSIAGIAVGCVAFVVIIAALLCICCMRKRKQKQQAQGGYNNGYNNNNMNNNNDAGNTGKLGRFNLFGGGNKRTSQQPMTQSNQYPTTNQYGGYGGYAQQESGVAPPQPAYR